MSPGNRVGRASAPHCPSGDVSVPILNASAGTLEKFFPAGMRGLFTALQRGLQSLPTLPNSPHSDSKFPTRFPHCRIPDYNLGSFSNTSSQTCNEQFASRREFFITFLPQFFMRGCIPHGVTWAQSRKIRLFLNIDCYLHRFTFYISFSAFSGQKPA